MKTSSGWRPLDLLWPLIALILVWPVVLRFLPPVQDRDFASFDGGSTDFACNYLGSLAFIRGFDPHLNGRPEFRDPWRREIQMEGVAVSQYYLPGHFIALAPLAWIYGDDWEAASRTYFWLHLILLALLAWIVAAAALRSSGPEGAHRFGRTGFVSAITFVLFCLHVGIRVGLERGQSDVIQAVLIWGGVALAASGQMALAGFLLVAGTSLKGYGVVLLLGLAVASFGRSGFRSFLLGSLAAGLPILALTWPFVLTGLKVALYKSGDFSYHWTVHGFKHIGWAISPEWADALRLFLSLMSLIVSIACWAGYRRALVERPDESTARLVIAAAASVTTTVGFSASSHAYNLVLILPALIWITHLIEADLRPPGRSHEALFAVTFLMLVLRTPLRHFAPAAYGLALLMIWCLLTLRTGSGGSLTSGGSLEGAAPGV